MKLKSEKPRGIDGSRQVYLPRRNRLKAEPGIIGHVADEQHEGEAFGARPRQSFRDQGGAESLARRGGVYNERPEQNAALSVTDADRSETDSAHQAPIEQAAQRKSRDGSYALAYAIGAAGEAAWPESLGREL